MTEPPAYWLDCIALMISFCASEANLSFQLVLKLTFSIELVTSFPVPQTRDALAFCVLLPNPNTLFAIPDAELLAVEDSILFKEP